MEYFVVIRLVALVALLSLTACGGRKLNRPRRCCSPDQWEADIKNFGTTTRVRDPDGHISGRFAYDYTNRRWAIEYKDASNRHNNRKLIFDHRQDAKILKTSKGCYNVTLNLPAMHRYCVPANATYHGYYDYGLNRKVIGYDIWSYEALMMPIRYVLRVSRDGCIPLQDTALTLIRNHWKWKEGEPICVPWQFPEAAASGDCFRSHVAHDVRRSGTRPTAGFYNMDFRNINFTITDETIFEATGVCQQLDDWPEEVIWTNFWSMLLYRMKLE